MISAMGLSPIGINDFGSILLKGSSLVPFPPAITTTGTSTMPDLRGSFLSSANAWFHVIKSITLYFSSSMGIRSISFLRNSCLALCAVNSFFLINVGFLL